MTGIEVDPRSLRDSASAAKTAAEVVRRLGFDTVSDIAGAMPGAESGQTSAKVEERLQSDTRTWSKNMDSYARKLDSAAERYESDDDEVRRSFGGW